MMNNLLVIISYLLLLVVGSRAFAITEGFSPANPNLDSPQELGAQEFSLIERAKDPRTPIEERIDLMLEMLTQLSATATPQGNWVCVIGREHLGKALTRIEAETQAVQSCAETDTMAYDMQCKERLECEQESEAIVKAEIDLGPLKESLRNDESSGRADTVRNYPPEREREGLR